MRAVRFAGYAALFDRPDRGGDVVRRGAFARSLGERGSVPLLWQHDPRRVAGVVERLSEDGRGLRLIGRAPGGPMAALIGRGQVAGLSFGYRVRRMERRGTYRELRGRSDRGLARDVADAAVGAGAFGSALRRRGFGFAQPLLRVSGFLESKEISMADGVDVMEASFAAAGDEIARDEVAALKEEMAALRGRVEQGMRAAARPALSGAAAARDPAASAFVDRYLRSGAEAGVELKSFVGTSDPAGGYAVPEELDARIDATLKAISPIRAIANVVKVGTSAYRKLVTTGGVASGWVTEDAARPGTDTPTFAEIAPPSGEIYANPAASQTMLDDAAFDVESWLAGEIATEFARAEGQAFVAGSGVNRPKGFLTYPVAATGDATRAFGTLQYLASGAADAFGANPQDRLIDLVQALRAPYRQGATFVMNSATLSAIRKLKTSDGAFLWQPGLVGGQPDTLLGYPVVEAEDMPDVAANALAIAFGNFRAGYLIAERRETAILRDPFSNKPFVHFYATKRVGGAVANSEAIKVMRFSAA